MGLFDPKCEVCEKRTPKKLLREGYCPDCYDTLLQYVELRDAFQSLTGATVSLAPKDIIKMSEEELLKAFSDAIHVEGPPPNTPEYVFSLLHEDITLELMLQCGIKRTKWASRGTEEVCADCRKRNGMVRTVPEAIEIGIHKDDAHKKCGCWVPLRERDPNADPDAWKKKTN